MARSIDPAPKAVRGFVPARTDEERYLMRHIEDLARTAESRGIPRYSGFLSDREQDLAKAALNRAEVPEADYHFEGGWPGAERKLLCIEPEGSWTDSPLCCVRLDCRALPGAALPTHRDYLGSLMGLELKREALGDIVLPPDAPGTAYVFALEPAAKLICQELCQAGRTDLSTTPMEPDALPAFPQAERTLQTATVSSLRLDAVLAAMLRSQPRCGGGAGHGRAGGDQPSPRRERPCARLRGGCLHRAGQGPLRADGTARKKQKRPINHRVFSV